MNEPLLRRLAPEEVDERVEIVCRFLAAVHPGLINEPEGFRPCVELRPIPRTEKNHSTSRSLNIWDLSDETRINIYNFFERHNGHADCLYYSVFTYDNHAKVLTKRGTPATPGKITGAAALYTSEIALDFDNIGHEEYTDLVDRFERMGIYALWVYTGHGYQAHILLDEPLEDKDILKRFVYLARAKGFTCDPACVDPARVMRLPGTYNCKCFSDPSYEDERDDPPLCKIMQESNVRYDIVKVIEAFQKQPTASIDDEQVYLNIGFEQEALPQFQGDPAPVQEQSLSAMATVATGEQIQMRRLEYPHLKGRDIPDAVMRMLSYTPKGLRNPALGFLVKHFKQFHHLSKTAILEILTIWSKEACVPAYPEHEFNSDFKRFYFFGGLNYDTALAKKFGHIDFQDLISIRKREILIPHKFIASMGDLSGQAVRMYLAIKMLEHMEEACTREAIANLLNLSVRAVGTTLKELVESRLVYIRKGVTRNKIPNTYHTDKFNSIQAGYTAFSYNDVKAYVSELFEGSNRGNGELKVYLYMRCKFSNMETFISQTTLSTTLGLAQNSISVIVNRLQEHHFLKIEKVYRSGLESCIYTLLR